MNLRFLKRRRIALVGIPIVIGIAALLWPLFKPGISQPIAFNHKIHAGELKLECSHCHQGVETGPFATLPSVEVCLACHMSPLSQNPEEAKVRGYGGEKGEIPWVRLTRMPDDVYFSHRRHVKFGEIPCEQCHGQMAERVRPPQSAPMELTMDDCLACHQKNHATEDCVLCHR